MPETPLVTPRLSAAIMVLRPSADDGSVEVFMVRRHVKSDFAPDVFVFPGGSVTDADREAELIPGVCVPLDALSPETALGTGVRAAAIRELFEEAGVLLALHEGQPVHSDAADRQRLAAHRAQLQSASLTIAELTAAEDLVLMTDVLTHCAHWITPEPFPKRFDTHFFIALHPQGQEASHDNRETVHGVWVRPATALQAYADGQFPLVFATDKQLRDLAQFATPAAAIAAWSGRVPPVIMPHIFSRNGHNIILMPGEPEPM